MTTVDDGTGGKISKNGSGRDARAPRERQRERLCIEKWWVKGILSDPY